jgi:uncharacterized protein YbjT (DUF2867 family)
MNETSAGSAGATLVTGATGYIGGRLISALERSGIRIRCLARHPAFLAPRVAATTEVVAGDVLDPATLAPALEGVDVAYYLIHSMGSTGDFENEDRRAALNFSEAARAAGVKRIVYLGGLGAGGTLSPHLHSRHEVGRILRESGVPTIEFRASIIIGSGSLSFEMIRSLVDRLPVMITPRWVRIRAQPVAVEDVIGYLVAAREAPIDGSIVVEIGGADVVSYGRIMEEYARQRGLKRLTIPVPVLTPWLSSLWLGLVTPLYATTGRKLIDSIQHETIVHDPEPAKKFVIRPRGISEAVARALRHEDQEFAATRWNDSRSSRGRERSWGGTRFGSRLVDSRDAVVRASPEAAFAPIRRIGGSTGWYYGNMLWRIRGFVDILAGGAGLRHGRRSPDRLAVGDTVDFWRVEAVEENRLLRLASEMKLPGRAWLQFEVAPRTGKSVITQTAMFDPVGVPGLLYWYALRPVHSLIFGGMLRGIAKAALQQPADTSMPRTKTVTSKR